MTQRQQAQIASLAQFLRFTDFHSLRGAGADEGIVVMADHHGFGRAGRAAGVDEGRAAAWLLGASAVL